jgi:hypothetical protein
MRWRAGVLAGAALVAAGCSNGAGATGPTGTVTGSYIRVGGPSGAPTVGLPGTISFRGGSGSLINFDADSAGKFSGQLPAGTYAVTAESSLINSGSGSCSVPLTTRVQAGKTVTITVVCSIS